MAIYRIKKYIQEFVKIVSRLFFYWTFLAFMCVLWVLWVIRLTLVCQYDARWGRGRCDDNALNRAFSGISLVEKRGLFCFMMMEWLVWNGAPMGHARSWGSSDSWDDIFRTIWSAPECTILHTLLWCHQLVQN